jgi:hypothetical protein
VATDYGGSHGAQPWNQPQPEPDLSGPRWTPRPGLPSSPPSSSPPGARPSGPRPSASGAARRRGRIVALVLLAVGAAGLLGSLAGVANQVLPRRFSAAQRQQLTDWEYGQRWRTLTAGAIFPAAVSYAPPDSLGDDPALTLSARRIGTARPASCAAAADTSAARVLDGSGCTALLRATYVDGTGSYVVTVGAAVLPGTAAATAAAQAIGRLPGAGGLRSTVHTAPFAGTLAASFTAGRRQLSGAAAGGSYVVLWTAGYADDRPREPVAGNDRYTDQEMTSAGAGVARAVLSVLAAPVPAPHCPGAPGC